MKNIIRRIALIVIITIIGFSITACKSDDNNPFIIDIPGLPNVPDVSDVSNIPGIPNIPNVLDVPTSFDMTAAELVAGMTVGWNLGNTFDAAGGETSWGNPKTTKPMIDTVKNAGFNTIRIPVTWTSYGSWGVVAGGASSSNNYTINTAFMNRVKEVVDYAVENNMYIILNTHHDHVFKFGDSQGGTDSDRKPAVALTQAEKQKSLDAFGRIWEQIADAFKDYDERLIFEALNEPRTMGSTAEWNGGTSIEHAVLNEHYQFFVDIVRGSGGNNDKRFLLINTYAASGTATAMNGLTLPDDPAENKLIVSYHAYEPYNFALNTSMSYTTWENKTSDTNPIKSPIDRYYNKFVSQGIPVIIGEMGALNKNENTAAREAWAEFYVEYAKSKEIICVWWDMGLHTSTVKDNKLENDTFAILNRTNNTWHYPGIVEAMMRGAGVLE